MGKKRCVLVAGGTGGHVFPAFRLAEEIDRHHDTVYLMIDRRGQSFQIPQALFRQVHSSRLRYRNQWWNRWLFFADLAKEIYRSLVFLRKIKADVVVGFGGYPSVPGVLAAQLLNIPTVIHEQNFNLGRANRFLAPRAQKVCISFKNTKTSVVPEDRFVWTGNPVRSCFELSENYAPPVPSERFNLLVVGGSQGAQILSEVVPLALAGLPESYQKRLRVKQQVRSEFIGVTRTTYRPTPIIVETEAFFNDMNEVYRWAHLVIARSGASTLAELSLFGCPVILVPYQAALESDQEHNAKAFDSENAAIVLNEAAFTPEKIRSLVIECMDNSQMLLTLSQNIKKCSIPDAPSRMMEVVAAVCGDHLIQEKASS